MKPVSIVVGALLLAGCATQFRVVEESTGHAGSGWMTSPDPGVVINTGHAAFYGSYSWNPTPGTDGRQLFLFGTAKDDSTITCDVPVDERFRGEGTCRDSQNRTYKVIFDR